MWGHSFLGKRSIFKESQRLLIEASSEMPAAILVDFLTSSFASRCRSVICHLGIEMIVGKVISAICSRSESLAREDFFIGFQADITCHENCGQALERIKFAIEDSTLGYFDLLVIPWPETTREDNAIFMGQSHPSLRSQQRISERIQRELFLKTWEALTPLVKLQKIKYLGLDSNSRTNIEYVLRTASILPQVNVIKMSPTHQEQSLIRLCHQKGIDVICSLVTKDRDNEALQAIEKLADVIGRSTLETVVIWMLQCGMQAMPELDRIVEPWDANSGEDFKVWRQKLVERSTRLFMLLHPLGLRSKEYAPNSGYTRELSSEQMEMLNNLDWQTKQALATPAPKFHGVRQKLTPSLKANSSVTSKLTSPEEVIGADYTLSIPGIKNIDTNEPSGDIQSMDDSSINGSVSKSEEDSEQLKTKQASTSETIASIFSEEDSEQLKTTQASTSETIASTLSDEYSVAVDKIKDLSLKVVPKQDLLMSPLESGPNTLDSFPSKQTEKESDHKRSGITKYPNPAAPKVAGDFQIQPAPQKRMQQPLNPAAAPKPARLPNPTQIMATMISQESGKLQASGEASTNPMGFSAETYPDTASPVTSLRQFMPPAYLMEKHESESEDSTSDNNITKPNKEFNKNMNKTENLSSQPKPGHLHATASIAPAINLQDFMSPGLLLKSQNSEDPSEDGSESDQSNFSSGRLSSAGSSPEKSPLFDPELMSRQRKF